MKTTNKKSVQQLVNILWQKGLTKIVISPGSRNAPLVIGFNDHVEYTCYSVPDERTAGFIALGMAQQTNSPVALVCSSGSALLNYYPAIAEAFYRKIPLVVLSADRPERLVDQGDGQTIRQKNVYANHILFSDQLEECDQFSNNTDKIVEALKLAVPSELEKGGPVHLNLPFEEPLYNLEEIHFNTERQLPSPISVTSNESLQHEIVDTWNHSNKILILVGQQDYHKEFNSWLNSVSNHALVFHETTSNLELAIGVGCIDRLITAFDESDKKRFQPDLLLTFGGNIVSKRIKALLRESSPKHHYHIEVTNMPPNTYQCLTFHLNYSLNQFISEMDSKLNLNPNDYSEYWNLVNGNRKKSHHKFAEKAPYSDFKLMSILNQVVPSNSIIHLANSTPVRYAQLFDWGHDLIFHANRGTSGIDGIVSTAMGTAISTDKQVILIIGDISFFYDTNAWWHRHIPDNLKVIVVNNNGGGIFRFIDGPTNSGHLENHFETHQKNSVKHIALGFEVNYFCSTEEDELEPNLQLLLNAKGSAILEVCTPQLENAGILKDYFKSLNS